jgi:hypothetical protein
MVPEWLQVIVLDEELRSVLLQEEAYPRGRERRASPERMVDHRRESARGGRMPMSSLP